MAGRSGFPFSRQENMRAGRGNPAGADHLHLGADEAQHVMDGVTRLHMPARRIDDDADVAFGFVKGEKLGRDPLRHFHVHFAKDQNRARFEQRIGHGRGLRLGRLVLVVILFVTVFVGAAQGLAPIIGD